MKKVNHILILLLLAIYFAFSSGVAFTVHHCCEHCFEVTEATTPCCDAHSQNDALCETECTHSAATPQPQHHHAHDAHFFFKIVDFYDISQTLTPLPWNLIQVETIISYPNLEESYLLLHQCKEHIHIPAVAFLQGEHIYDFLQQRIFYS